MVDLRNFKPNKQKASNRFDNKSISKFFFQEINLGLRKTFSIKKKENLYSELSVLISNGVTVKDTLDIIKEQQSNKIDRAMIENIQIRIRAGESFAKAMEMTSLFSTYEIRTIEIGEETRNLKHVFFELANHFRTRIKLRNQLISALTYPAIVILTAFGAISFMLLYIVPMFIEIFKRFNTELPWLTQYVIKVSNIFINALPIIICFVLISIFFWKRYTKNDKWKMFEVQLIRRIPFLGKLIEKNAISGFASTMSLLLSSKVDIVKTLKLTASTLNYPPISIALNNVQQDIIMGNSLHTALSKHDVFSQRVVSIVKVGEEINKLDKSFERISTQLSIEVENELKILSILVEPILIIFLGLFVGIILVSMYLPLFSLSTSIH
jgi:type IV pilus assembly protein PilC